jgi:hypothetical protein
MPYTHLRCIGLSTYSGVAAPQYDTVVSRPDKGYLQTGTYTGLADASADIQERCAYVQAAIQTARQLFNANDDAQHLKVFMTPEFLFRGAAGAYSFEERDELVRRLYNLAADPVYAHWLFVFGSILSWSAPTRRRSTFNRTRVLNDYRAKEVYNTVLVVPGGWRNDLALRDAAWGRLAGTKLPANYSEQHFAGEMGADVGWLVTKKFRSSVDFIWFDNFINGRGSANLTEVDIDTFRDVMFDKGVMKGYREAMSDWQIWREVRGILQNQQVLRQKQAEATKLRARHRTRRAERKIRERAPAWAVPRTYHRYAGTAVLQYDNVSIAVEICLDHLSERLAQDNTRGGAVVDLHLIPSAGMTIQEDAIVAKNNGHVFNNDGARPEMTDGQFHNAMLAAANPAEARAVRRKRRRCVLERQRIGVANRGVDLEHRASVVYATHANILANGPGEVQVFPIRPV